MVHNLLLLTILSACGGFLSSRKSVARGALQTFLPKRTLPPHKNIPQGAAPIGLSREKIKGVVETLLLEVHDHVDFEGYLFYFEDGGGGSDGGGGYVMAMDGV
jgi:hypothetical protein